LNFGLSVQLQLWLSESLSQKVKSPTVLDLPRRLQKASEQCCPICGNSITTKNVLNARYTPKITTKDSN